MVNLKLGKIKSRNLRKNKRKRLKLLKKHKSSKILKMRLKKKIKF